MLKLLICCRCCYCCCWCCSNAVCPLLTSTVCRVCLWPRGLRPHYAREIWKRNNHRSFWIYIWGKLVQGNHVIIVMTSVSKSSVFKTVFVHTKTQNCDVSKFLRFKRFRKAPFSWRISVDGRPSCRNKAAFSNSSGLVWTGLQGISRVSSKCVAYLNGAKGIRNHATTCTRLKSSKNNTTRQSLLTDHIALFVNHSCKVFEYLIDI